MSALTARSPGGLSPTGPGDAPEEVPATSSHVRVLDLIRRDVADNRSHLAATLQVGPSTVSRLVADLLELRIVRESGSGVSTGGRKPRTLQIRGGSGHVLVATLGATHVRSGLVDLAGDPVAVQEDRLQIEAGPERCLATVRERFTELAGQVPAGSVLQGVGVGLPGPVQQAGGYADSPSRMPGWDGFPVRTWAEQAFAAPAYVENDANLMTLGEQFTLHSNRPSFVCIKVGTGIGAGMVVDGELYRGFTGVAGDISHARVTAAGNRACGCGNRGCLETIASGAAIVQDLNEAGIPAASVGDVIRLVKDAADPTATTMVRSAGRHLGEVLAVIVNFFNPSAVVLGGALSACEPFLAAVRSRLYESCHPLVTQSLTISTLTAGRDAGLLGAAHAILRAGFVAPTRAA